MLESEPMIEATTDSGLARPRKPSARSRAARLAVAFVAVALIAGAVVAWGIRTRIDRASVVREKTLELAVPTVAVAHPRRGALRDEVVLPGNIQAFTDAPIYARANGYLKRWHRDIGARVKAGELLAEI